MACKLKHATAENNAVEYLKKNGLVTSDLEVTDPKGLRKANMYLSDFAENNYGVSGTLVDNIDGTLYTNTPLFYQIDAVKDVWYQENMYLKDKLNTTPIIPTTSKSKIPSIIIDMLKNMQNRSGVAFKFVTVKEAEELLGTPIGSRTAFIQNNKVHFISSRFDIEDAVHEYGHLWVLFLKNTNLNVYNRLKSIVLEDNSGKQWLAHSVRNNLHYTEEEHYEEAMAKLLGLAGKDIVSNSGIYRVFYDVLNSLKRLIDKTFGTKFTHNMTIKDFARDLVGGTTTFKINDLNITVPNILFNTRSSRIEDLEATQNEIQLNADESKYIRNGVEYSRLTDFVNTLRSYGKVYSNNIQAETAQLADELWAGKDPLEKLDVSGISMDNKTLSVTKAEYIASRNAFKLAGAAKGNLFHARLEEYINIKLGKPTEEAVKKIGKILASAVSDFDWMNNATFDKIMKIAGIDFDSDLPKALRDYAASELKLTSEIMGLGTAIDLAVEHFDGRISMFDYKTSNNFDIKLTGNILNSAYVENTPRNVAKVELALRAVIWKLEQPDVKFRKLSILHYNNARALNSTDFDSDVDMSLLLPLIEAYYKKNNPSMYAAMKAKSPNIFKVGEYVSISNTTALAMHSHKLSHSDYLALLKAKLQRVSHDYDLALAQGFQKSLEKEGIAIQSRYKKEIDELTKQILELSRLENMIGIGVNNKDISTTTKYFGQFGDLNSVEAQTLKLMMNQAKVEYDKEINDLLQRLQTYAKPLLDEYLDKHPTKKAVSTITRGYINFTNYTEMFSPLYKKNKEGHYMMITKDDAEWTNLSKVQQQFLTFLQVNYKKLADDVMNQSITGYEQKDTNFYKALFNDKQSDFTSVLTPAFALQRGFFAKIPMTDHEFNTKYGYLTPEARKSYKNKLLNALLVRNDKKSLDIGLPIKYMTSFSEDYSMNLALGFEAFARTMLEKKHYDGVYAVGEGLIGLLENKADLSTTERREVQSNLKTFIRSKLMTDITKEVHKTELTVQSHRIDINKLESHYRRLISLVIMAVKPISGAVSGGIVPFLISARHGLAGTIANKFIGVKESSVDFDEGDVAWATKEWALMEGDALRGNLRTNKAWMLLKHLNYLPSDYSYALNEEDGAITRNPAFASKYNYIFHTFWENSNATIIMLAQLRHMKLENDKSVYDAYKVESYIDDLGVQQHKLAWTEGVRMKVKQAGTITELTELSPEEILRMKRVYQKMQGSYRTEEKVAAELHLIGRMAMQFRKYLPTMIIGAFGSRHEDYSYGEYVPVEQEDGETVYEWQARVIEGRYRLLFRMLKDVVTMKGKESWNDLTDTEKVELTEAMLTLVMFILGALSAGALFGDDDDDENKKLYYRIIENISQQYNFIDWLRSVKNAPATIAKLWDFSTGLSTLFLSLPGGIVGDKDSFTQDGYLKGTVQTIKGVPYLASIYALLKYFENNSFYGDRQWLKDYLVGVNLGVGIK